MKTLTLLLLLFLSAKMFSQTLNSTVEFVGNKIQVLQTKGEVYQATGKLSTGEIIRTGCDRGECYFRIDYKGRTIEKIVGGGLSKMTVYEFDFGADGDNEIVIVNNFTNMDSSKVTCSIFIYAYSKGIIEKMFEREMLNYKTVLKKDYIEYYMPRGLDSIWNYYQGQFWKMTPEDRNKFRIK